MEKWFKYFLTFVVAALTIGIFTAINMPKPKMSVFDRSEMNRMIIHLNEDLPREIGTIGYLDSIKNIDQTIFYIMSVKGDNRIKKVYAENYDEFKELLKYTVLILNGQRGMGDKLVAILDAKGLDMGVRIYTPNREFTDWRITGEELKNFAESCRLDPTAALHQVIDMQIEIANLSLPMKPGDGTPIRSVTLNSIESEDDDSFLLQSITHLGNSIVFLYDVDEEEQDLDLMKANSNNDVYIENIAAIAAEDADVKEFFGCVALSRSNIVLQYVGRTSRKKVEILLPYKVIRKYCKVPAYLLFH